MSPGPVSDSYDPEFGTGENARKIAREIETCIRAIASQASLRGRRPILDVVNGSTRVKYKSVALTVRDWRIVRFALHRALESM